MERLTIRYGSYAHWNGDQNDSARERMNKLLDRLAAYEDTGLTPEEINALQARQSWVPVSERLPEVVNDDESSDDVLIAIKYVYDSPGEKPVVCCGYLLDGEWWAYTEHDCHKIGEKLNAGDSVTHWMPLPAPPKEAHDER